MNSCLSIQSITPTVCNLFGISPPSTSSTDLMQAAMTQARQQGLSKIDRCLIYAPDAIGLSIYNQHIEEFDLVKKYAPTQIPLQSVHPSKTPVCFASMFTGREPAFHGITKYERPIIKKETLFDALLKGGKRVAIIAVSNSSIDLIFRERNLDYFSEKYDEEVTSRTIKVLEADQHDFILAYHQEYDDRLHKTTPYGVEAVQALKRHILSFGNLAEAANIYWKKYNRAIFFAPDHGAHINPTTQKGTHGDNIPEDMDIQHFVGFGNSLP